MFSLSLDDLPQSFRFAYLGQLEELKGSVQGDPNCLKETVEGLSILHICAMGGSVEVFDWLRKLGLHPFNLSESGFDALMLAASHNRLPLVNRLIELRADPFSYNRARHSALIISAAHGHLSVFQSLVTHAKGVALTPIHELKLKRDLRISLLFAAHNNQITILDWLEVEGEDLLCVDNNGDSVFFCAAETGNLRLLKRLLNKGFDLNQKNSNGYKALQIAKIAHRHLAFEFIYKAMEKKGLTIPENCRIKREPVIVSTPAEKEQEPIDCWAGIYSFFSWGGEESKNLENNSVKRSLKQP